MKTKFLMSLEESKVHIEIEGKRIDLIVKLCTVLEEHPEIRSIIKEAVEVQEMFTEFKSGEPLSKFQKELQEKMKNHKK